MSRVPGKWLGLLACVTLLAAACGSAHHSAGSSPTTAAAGGVKYNPAGVLKVAENLGQPYIQFDPATTLVADNTDFEQLVYGTLMDGTAVGPWTPGLAQTATIVNPSTIQVTLRSNLVFSDGEALNAQALANTIDFNRTSKAVAFRQEIHDVASVDVSSPTTVVIHLAKPVAGAFYPLLNGLETMPIPPSELGNAAKLASNPVGAGPGLTSTIMRLSRRRSTPFKPAKWTPLRSISATWPASRPSG
jgi:ABC-type transport system substrate-binding protein